MDEKKRIIRQEREDIYRSLTGILILGLNVSGRFYFARYAKCTGIVLKCIGLTRALNFLLFESIINTKKPS